MKLRIITPERVVLESEAEAVYAETIDGEIGILPRHIPLVTPLAVGVLRFQREGRKEPVAVMGGLLRTDGETVSVLSDAAERAEEIDALRAQHARDRAEAQLKGQLSDVDVLEVKAALMRSITRLKAKERFS